MKARREMVESVAGRYQQSGKGEKGAILDEFVATSGYSRWHASYLLRWWGRKVWAGDQKVLVVGAPRKKKRLDRSPLAFAEMINRLRQVPLRLGDSPTNLSEDKVQSVVDFQVEQFRNQLSIIKQRFPEGFQE